MSPFHYQDHYTVEGFELELVEHVTESNPRSWEYLGDTFSLTIAESVDYAGRHYFDAIFANPHHPHISSIHSTPERAALELVNHLAYADAWFATNPETYYV